MIIWVFFKFFFFLTCWLWPCAYAFDTHSSHRLDSGTGCAVQAVMYRLCSTGCDSSQTVMTRFYCQQHVRCEKGQITTMSSNKKTGSICWYLQAISIFGPLHIWHNADRVSHLLHLLPNSSWPFLISFKDIDKGEGNFNID